VHPFHYQQDHLWCETVPLERIAAEFQTPVFVYSRAALEHNLRFLQEIFQPFGIELLYAVKANPNPHLLRLIRQAGLGADIVSGGELYLCQRAGFTGGQLTYTGVGKTAAELSQALATGVAHFTAESRFELELLEKLCTERGAKATVLLRVNPDIDAGTHPHISTGMRHNKFGLPVEEVRRIFAERDRFPHLDFRGLHAHLGSQISRAEPYEQLIERLDDLVRSLEQEGHRLDHIDLGGGFGVDYRRPLDGVEPYRSTLERIARKARQVFPTARLFVEPGRILVSDVGLLLTRVLGVKSNGDRIFVVVDAAMTDLLRPALYQANHAVLPVRATSERLVADLVGPVCETADTFAVDRELPRVRRGDLLVLANAGAYGATMGSNYNSRPLATEVLVEEGEVTIIRPRQTLEELAATYGLPAVDKETGIN